MHAHILTLEVMCSVWRRFVPIVFKRGSRNRFLDNCPLSSLSSLSLLLLVKASIYSPLPPSRPSLLRPSNESIKSWFMWWVWLHLNCRYKNKNKSQDRNSLTSSFPFLPLYFLLPSDEQTLQEEESFLQVCVWPVFCVHVFPVVWLVVCNCTASLWWRFIRPGRTN